MVSEGRIGIVEGDHVVDLHDRLNATVRQRIAGMVDIRDRARALLSAQLGATTDQALIELRRRLNQSYDRFVGKHGYLSSRANASPSGETPDYPLLLSLEHYDEEEEVATKAAIFEANGLARPRGHGRRASRRGTRPVDAVEGPGRSRLHGPAAAGTPEDAVADLSARGMIYLNPEGDRHEPADEYLSGNVKRKLTVALAAGDACRANVAALEKVIPEDLPPGDIALRLGAVWVPADVVEAFIKEVLGLQDTAVRYLAVAGTWSVTFNDWAARQSVACIQEYGTRRMHAIDLVQHALNVQTPRCATRTLRRTVPTSSTRKRCSRRGRKLGLIRDRFAAWAYEDAPRRERLCRIYNDLFNCIRQREFDGSHLKLPGFSQCFELHASQRNAIWRVVQSGNTGLFHAVGAGKTAIMVAASMELRRLGLANKPAHIVPNHCLEQYAAELVRLYPSAAVLMATKEDLAGDRRREFVARVATGDWDAIVMTHSTFELLPMSAGFTGDFIRTPSARSRWRCGCAARQPVQPDRQSLERMKKTWKIRLERLENQDRKDDFLCWEALGVDWLVRRGPLGQKPVPPHKMARIAGLPLSNSQRAFDLYLKTRHTMSLYRGEHRGVVLTRQPRWPTAWPRFTRSSASCSPTLRSLGLRAVRRLGRHLRGDGHGAGDCA